MKQKRFSVAQIREELKRMEAGVPLAEVIRRVGISDKTFYPWKKPYVGLEVDQKRQWKQLQDEKSRLKRLVADPALDWTRPCFRMCSQKSLECLLHRKIAPLFGLRYYLADSKHPQITTF